MEKTQPSMMKSALNFGAILGLVLMIISLITYVFEMYEANQWLSWVSIGILAAGIYIGTKNYRDKVKGGYIAYSNALGYGTLIALFAGIITSAFTFIYLGYIDDGFLSYTLTAQEDQMYESGMPEDQIEMSMKYTKMFMKPAALGLMGIFMNTFLGFIISLIIAAILKKEPKDFAQA